MTLGLFDSMIATQELVVPKSIPMVLKEIGLDQYSNVLFRRVLSTSQKGKVMCYLRCEAAGAM